MLRRLGIRGKILAVVAVPITVLLVAAVFVVLSAVDQLGQARNSARLIEVVDTAKTFDAAFHDEGDAAANYLSAWNSLPAQIENSQGQVAGVVASLESLGVTDLDTILGGGQPTDFGPAMSLEDARDVQPRADEEQDGWLAWPDATQAALAGASYQAMAAVARERSDQAQDGSELELAYGLLNTYLLQEGNRVTRFLTETPAIQEELLTTFEPSDQQWQRLSAAIDSVPANEENASVLAVLKSVQSDYATQAGVRETIRDRRAGATPTWSWYFGITGDLVGVAEDIALVVSDPTLARQLDAYAATDALVDQMRAEDNQVDRVLRAGQFATGEDLAVRKQFARTDFIRANATEALAALGSGYILPEVGASFDVSSQNGYQGIRNRVQDGTGNQLATAARLEWPLQTEEELAVIYPFQDQTLQLVKASASANEQQTLLRTILTAAGAIIVVVASFLIALLIARRIVGPLRRLTTTATAVRQELPRLVERVALPGERVDVSEVQIPVESSDEVGRLAEAFNSVNAATLAIASEQAALRGSISEMFVNVARRDQVLLNRQLASIDEMERTEDNQETLTKLFALDHLATRMRRNSESLLVLAGIDTGRRLRRPMPLSDVIRTASSEIELYERVELELDSDPSMVGHSALTAAHLFAELLENATVFSDPGTPVVVRTMMSGANYVVTVTDSGIGMTPEELAEANSRVASSAASEILGAQRLGLFVVGRIARRVGARVEISSVEGEGTVATVTMPPSLFDASVEAESVYAPAGATDEGMHVPAALLSHNADDEEMDDYSDTSTSSRVANLDPYTPAVIETGRSLSGRAEGEDSFDDDVQALIAADAANAPSGDAVDLAGLTDGVGETGLPTRRRTGAKQEARRETDSIIGLPARATDAQLSALEDDSNSGFTPVVSASEVSPQTAEARAAVFRGFRARGAGDEPDAGLAPDAESLGQAVRRGAVVPDEIPPLAPDDVDESAPGQDAFEESSGEAADAPHAEESVVTQSPLIQRGYEHDDSPSVPPSFEIPALDLSGRGDDDLPIAAVPPIASSGAIPMLEDDEPSFADHEPMPSGGVESVSLDEAEPDHGTQEAVNRSSFLSGSDSADSAPVATEGQPVVPERIASVPAMPVSSTPSLDDLIMAGGGEQESGGFFSKLFKRSGKKDESSSGASGPGAQEPIPTMSQPSRGLPISAPFTPSLDAQQGATDEEETPYSPAVGVQPAAAAPPFDLSASEAPSVEPTAFAPAAQDFEAPSESPSWSADPFAGLGGSQNPSGEGLTPAAGAVPYNPGALGGDALSYSPDQLARPIGWETAGASALEAAAPEQQSYRPIVQVDPHEFEAPAEETDLASEVFSELSSLSSERPKVETTRAGLLKRRPADAPPVEVNPIDEILEARPSNRDAEAVRSRFSSFYSGTQRARSDVEAFEASTQAELSER